MIAKLQVGLLILLIPLGALYLYSESQGIRIRDIFAPGTPIAIVGEVPIKVEIADTQEKRIQGLSGRNTLEGVEGMLFVFESADYHEIWMKDMLFPIDIIWIDESFTIVSIDQDVSPASYPRKYRPLRPAKYAIETKARFTDTFGIRSGLLVRLPLQVPDATSGN